VQATLGGEGLPIDPEAGLLKVVALAHADVSWWGLQVVHLQAGDSTDASVHERAWEQLVHHSGEHTGELVSHVAWKEYAAAQERLRKALDSCHKAGIQRRRTQVMEEEARTLDAFARHLLPLLGMSLSQPSVRDAVRQALQMAAHELTGKLPAIEGTAAAV
jgi:hypothetical protein